MQISCLSSSVTEPLIYPRGWVSPSDHLEIDLSWGKNIALTIIALSAPGWVWHFPQTWAASGACPFRAVLRGPCHPTLDCSAGFPFSNPIQRAETLKWREATWTTELQCTRGDVALRNVPASQADNPGPYPTHRNVWFGHHLVKKTGNFSHKIMEHHIKFQISTFSWNQIYQHLAWVPAHMFPVWSCMHLHL